VEGTAAIAGYGTAARLEYLLIPLVFGLGSPLVAIVGTCIGAGMRERALHATWVGAATAFLMTELIGLTAALWPNAWLGLFGSRHAAAGDLQVYPNIAKLKSANKTAPSCAPVLAARDLPGQGLDLRFGQRGKIRYLYRLDSRSYIGVMLL
jgi:hypothetical protein